MIILITGLKGSGKDTVGDWLEYEYNFHKTSFAGPLKDVVASMFGWEREQLEGLSIRDRIWRERKDERWSELLGRDITPRLMLQEMGTDVIRKGFNDNMWVFAAMAQIDPDKDYCFTDTRFPNEITILKNRFDNVVSINVIRPPMPLWYGDKNAAMIAGVHSSEYTMMEHNHLIDHTIINDQGIPELCNWIDIIMETY